MQNANIIHIMHNFESKSIDIDRLKMMISLGLQKPASELLEIQRKSGVHQSQISRIRRGRFNRASRNVLAICKAIGLSPPIKKGASYPGVPEVIKKAIDAAWDGTNEQAMHYAKLISLAGKLAKK